MHDLNDVITALEKCTRKIGTCVGCIFRENCSTGDCKQIDRESLYWLKRMRDRLEGLKVAESK